MAQEALAEVTALHERVRRLSSANAALEAKIGGAVGSAAPGAEAERRAAALEAQVERLRLELHQARGGQRPQGSQDAPGLEELAQRAGLLAAGPATSTRGTDAPVRDPGVVAGVQTDEVDVVPLGEWEALERRRRRAEANGERQVQHVRELERQAADLRVQLEAAERSSAAAAAELEQERRARRQKASLATGLRSKLSALEAEEKRLREALAEVEARSSAADSRRAVDASAASSLRAKVAELTSLLAARKDSTEALAEERRRARAATVRADSKGAQLAATASRLERTAAELAEAQSKADTAEAECARLVRLKERLSAQAMQHKRTAEEAAAALAQADADLADERERCRALEADARRQAGTAAARHDVEDGKLGTAPDPEPEMAGVLGDVQRMLNLSKRELGEIMGAAL